MGYFISVITSLCAIMPSWVVIGFLAVIALALVVMIVKIVGFVLDAIPFL